MGGYDYDTDPSEVIQAVAVQAAAQAIEAARAEELNQSLAGLQAHNQWEQQQRASATTAEAQRLLNERLGSRWEESEQTVSDFIGRHPSFIDPAAMADAASLASALESVLPYAEFEREQRVGRERQLVQEKVKRAIREAPGTQWT